MEADDRNTSLRTAGEEFVLDVERRRLAEIDRADLAMKVRWVAADDCVCAGYDLLSFNSDGRKRLITVKTTNEPARTPFTLSRKERILAIERPMDWCIYQVYNFAIEPCIFTISPPLGNAVYLHPET
jgi:hypothetical protein